MGSNATAYSSAMRPVSRPSSSATLSIRKPPAGARHAAVHVALANLVPGVRAACHQRRADQRVGEQQQVNPIFRAEVETRGSGEEHQLRDPRLGQLEQRYQTFSMMTTVTRIAASGNGTMKIRRRRQRSNFRCMKNSATSSAFQTARKSSNNNFTLRDTGSSNANATSATVSTNKYSQIRT